MILIGRGLNHEAGVSGGEGSTPSRKDPLERKTRRSVQVNSNCAVVKVRINSVRQKGKPSRSGTMNRIQFPVVMARGSHLFPYRTQKLSLSALMVLGWKRPGRVGRRRIPKNDYGESKDISGSLFLSSSMAEHSAVNRVVVGSSPTWGASKNGSELFRSFFLCSKLRRNQRYLQEVKRGLQNQNSA